MNKYVTKLSQKKPADVKRELGRSHLIVALLAIVIIVLLMQGTLVPMAYDLTLATVTSILLAIVVLISLSVSYAFLRTKKK
jgi:hypothetical protein